MYRSCIFCSAPLGSNESLERFPVGRSLAFDAAKGRLWAVCGRCARWNLAPIEERWEAIEDAERLFRDTRMRVQSESIGLAKLRDGTRLVRIGDALDGELAAWRYGETLVRRRRRMLIRTAPAMIAGLGVLAAGVAVGGGALTAYGAGSSLVDLARDQIRWRKVILQVHGEDGSKIPVSRWHLAQARLGVDQNEVELHLPPLPGNRRFLDAAARPLVLRGGQARMALGRAMLDENANGAPRKHIDRSLAEIQRVGSPEEFLVSIGRQGLLLNGSNTPTRTVWQQWKEGFRKWGDPAILTEPITLRASPRMREEGPRFSPVALEMALHEETERRALDGELAMLEAMWREAEEIAGIADRLPELPAPEPPRMEG